MIERIDRNRIKCRSGAQGLGLAGEENVNRGRLSSGEQEWLVRGLAGEQGGFVSVLRPWPGPGCCCAFAGLPGLVIGLKRVGRMSLPGAV